ncbi:MAG TPA: hypothetical protein VGM88_00950 [Kofleriaceae bacterium]|jgi:hypothetical protein
MANYLISAEPNVDAVAPGGTVIVTIRYNVDADPMDSPLLVACSPAFRVTFAPAMVTLGRAEDETGAVTVAATIEPTTPHAPDSCILIFNGLNDQRWVSIEVTS